MTAENISQKNVADLAETSSDQQLDAHPTEPLRPT